MITIDLGTIEHYNPSDNTFTNLKGGIVRFEYSLKAVYDWEGKWKKPFLKNSELTHEEMFDFCMKMAMDPIDERFLTPEVIDILVRYVADDKTATTFNTIDGQNGNKSNGRGKHHTAEEIYALMFMAQVPLEWEYRNLSRLMVVLRIIDNYNQPPKKMSKEDVLKRNARLNEERKKRLKTKG